MPELDTASAITMAGLNSVTLTVGSVSEIDQGDQVFVPLFGCRISDPLVLPGTPVTASIVRWKATTTGGATVKVETSINNGASWDLATNNGPVPRLRPGDTVTRSVLTRVTLTRAAATDESPRVSLLELQVSCDAAVDELVPIAYGVIDKVTVQSSSAMGSGSSSGSGASGVIGRGGGQFGGGRSIKVHAVDLSRSIKLAQWEQPFTVPTGISYGAACKYMITDRLPNQTAFEIASDPHTVDDLLVYGLDQGGDPWQDITELAQSAGCETFPGPAGEFVFRPIPDPRYGIAVWEFDENANPVVTDAKKELNDEPVKNYVVVKGESTSSKNPVTAFSFDNDPSSASYVGGKLGKRVTRLTFPLITTQEQAQSAANGVLYNSIGLADQVTITCVPMPALEPGDIVKVNISDVKSNGTYLINQITTPLSPAGAQVLVCYRQSTNA